MPTAPYCNHPDEGCPCAVPGAQAACGTVMHTDGDYVTCSMGHRACEGDRWGRCVGERDVTTKRFTPSAGSLSPLAFDASVPCGTFTPCDPYCRMFDDSAPGLPVDAGSGLSIVDGGLILTPTADAGSGSSFVSLPAGVTSCSPDRNIVGPACAPPGYATCQQDFHCDAATSTCLWNNGPGYYDPTIAGADITIGAPCGPGGSVNPTFPLCNRGSVAVPAGATITIHQYNPPAVPNGCAAPGGPPDCTYTLATPLAPGECQTKTYCQNSMGGKFLTVNQGPSGGQPATEAPGLCANNSAYVKTDATPGCMGCGSACNTRVLGKVYDPSASPGSLGNNIGIANAVVYQPSKPLITFAPLPTCDSCSSLQTPYVTATTTDSTGSFVLTGVSPGTAVPIVVQSGRWRRQITVNVTACADNAPAAGTFHLPSSRTDGLGGVAEIPKMAVATGNHDPLECLLLKMGIASSEIQRRVSSADANRIQLYYTNGTKTSPAQPTSKQLWNGTVNIQNEYSAVILGCETSCMSGPPNMFSQDAGCTAMTATEKNRLRDFVNAGGRAFGTHGGGQPFIQAGSPFASAVSGWAAGGSPSYVTPVAGVPNIAGPAKGRINTGTAAQDRFRDWMRDNGGSTFFGTGWARIDNPWSSVANVNPATTTEWIRGSSTNAWGAGNYVLSLSFDTPLAPAAACGRVVYSSMHTSPARAGGISTYGKAFPGACALAAGMSEEERALEYQIFQLTSCGFAAVTPPPPPPPLSAVTYFGDYHAVCNTGEKARWAPLYWQAAVPAGTSVVFRAATATTQAGLPPAPPAAAPTTALVGTASVNALAPAWDCQGCPGAPVTVEKQLEAQTGTSSSDWLRLFITLHPDATQALSPVLYNWRQIYDCVPVE